MTVEVNNICHNVRLGNWKSLNFDGIFISVQSPRWSFLIQNDFVKKSAESIRLRNPTAKSNDFCLMGKNRSSFQRQCYREIKAPPPTQVNQLFALWPHPTIWKLRCSNVECLTQHNNFKPFPPQRSHWSWFLYSIFNCQISNCLNP